jgi:glyoxylase-like metal-dependent hydrolase (beta-lactamase superfamily II)
VEPEAARASEVASGVWRLRLPLSWPGIPAVNAYAMTVAEGGVVLVDCGGGGDPSCHAALERALAESGHRVEDVRAVVLTHYHSDHAGALEWLVDRTGCAVLGHPDYAHFTDGGERPDEIAAARRRRAAAEGVPHDELEAYADVSEERDGIDAPVHPGIALREGDTVKSSLGTWQVLETPGHCPSHICLLEPRSRTLIVGDLLAHEFHPWFDYGYSADPVAETATSLARLAELGELALVLPGHGRPLDDASALIAMHQRELQSRLDAVRAAVAGGATTGYEINQAVFGPDLSESDVVWRLAELLAYLRHERLANRIERRTDSAGVFRYALVAAPDLAARPG